MRRARDSKVDIHEVLLMGVITILLLGALAIVFYAIYSGKAAFEKCIEKDDATVEMCMELIK